MGRLLLRGPQAEAALRRGSGLVAPVLLTKTIQPGLSAQFLRELAGQEGRSSYGSITGMKTGRRV